MNYKTIKNIDPLKFFAKLSKEEKNVCFLHSFSKNGWKTTIAWNPKEKFKYKMGDKENSIETFKKFSKKNAKKGRKLIGYFSYDIGYELHQIKKTAKDDLRLPDILFYAFDNWITFEKNQARVQEKFYKELEEINKRKISPTNKTPKSKNFKATISKEKYNKAYKKIKNYIKKGDIYQINYTHRLEASSEISARKLFLKVIKENKVDHLAYMEGEGFEILSASPERFVKIKDRKIETCPIKGTRPRGKAKKEDEKLRQELLDSEKEAAELNMITDLLRNDLGKISKIGTVKVKANRLVQKCPTVWHTYSKITGVIDKKTSNLDALISMLSGGSITGCPKKRAMEIIDELENKTRNIYTGVIGFINPNQDLDFNIAIRTIIKKEQKLHLQVGGGIVLDSTNKAEFKETFDKAKSFMKIL